MSSQFEGRILHLHTYLSVAPFRIFDASSQFLPQFRSHNPLIPIILKCVKASVPSSSASIPPYSTFPGLSWTHFLFFLVALEFNFFLSTLLDIPRHAQWLCSHPVSQRCDVSHHESPFHILCHHSDRRESTGNEETIALNMLYRSIIPERQLIQTGESRLVESRVEISFCAVFPRILHSEIIPFHS